MSGGKGMRVGIAFVSAVAAASAFAQWIEKINAPWAWPKYQRNLGSVPSRWLGGSVVRWLGSCANPQPETHASRPENDGLVPKAPIPKCRIIHKGQANIMQIACAVAGSVPRFSDEDLGWSEEISSEKGVHGISSKDPIYLSPLRGSGGEPDCYLTCILNIMN